MKVAVTGGAGYIGSHAVLELKRAGHEVVVLDNLSEGHPQAVDEAELLRVDLANEDRTRSILRDSGADAVMHFAASAYVGESVDDPQKYYFNNVVNTLQLLRAMIDLGIQQFVFSGSCTVYGIPDSIPITEGFPLQPISPYGRTKATVEGILSDYAEAYGLQYASLRYFNAAGAVPDGRMGEDHDPETHLIPIVIEAALGQRDNITIFGTDYPTPDGTCIRDYIHVLDLGRAHVLALENLDQQSPAIYNLGTGTGNSVREVIDTVGTVSGREIPVREGDRRPGDPPRLVSSPEKAEQELGWEPQYPELTDIVETAWQWHSTHPDGYEDE
ncbi:MAG: UDP-glucose 4-epimerase GalE [Planctomycetota bacterium]